MPNTKKADAKNNVVPVRFSDKTMQAVKQAAQKDWGPRSDSEILRIAAEIGLAVLVETNYDVGKIVARFALGSMDVGNTAAESVLERMEKVDRDESRPSPSHARKAKAGDTSLR